MHRCPGCPWHEILADFQVLACLPGYVDPLARVAVLVQEAILN